MITHPISTTTYWIARRRRRRGEPLASTGSALLVRVFFTARPCENTAAHPRVQGKNQKVQAKSAEYKQKIVTSTAGSSVVFLLTTLGADTDAAAFARTLVDENLAACVSVLPLMSSVYRWRGAIEEAREQQLLIKTTLTRIDDLRDRFRTLHPYELPEFVVLQPVDASRMYAAWVVESTT
jgi:periplasmic divalent cation tolerance protein